jgi:hypothetical protein
LLLSSLPVIFKTFYVITKFNRHSLNDLQSSHFIILF